MNETPPPLPTTPEPIPQDLVTAFVDGSFEREAARGRQPHLPISKLYYQRDETLPSGQRVRLDVRYERERTYTAIRFFYFTPQGDQLASMVINVTSPDHFSLPHREVEQSARRTGVGTYLLKQVEQWIENVARLRAHPITLSVAISQYDVLQWLTKMGFVPSEEDRTLYEDIVADASGDKYHVDAWTQRTNLIFGRTPEGQVRADPVRLTMVKTYAPSEAAGTSPA